MIAMPPTPEEVEPPAAAAVPLALPPVVLSVAAVARRIGVAPATLRTWDRRYGLGPSQHAAGSHRRYGPADVARLEIMRRLIHAGVNPGDAARAALTHPLGPADEPPERPSDQPAQSEPVPGRSGGGRVLSLPSGTAEVRGLARAAMALDGSSVLGLVQRSVAAVGVVATWVDLICPVLRSVGLHWETTGEGVEVEHLLSESVGDALRGVTSGLSRPVNPRPVLLASAEDEQHSLPLLGLAAALAEQSIACRVLGARLPRQALAAAVRRSGPAAVLVWSQVPSSGDPGQLADLPSLRPTPLILAGGPGWHGDLPAGAVRVGSLQEAVDMVADVAAVSGA
jgi:hypothetical protein